MSQCTYRLYKLTEFKYKFQCILTTDFRQHSVFFIWKTLYGGYDANTAITMVYFAILYTIVIIVVLCFHFIQKVSVIRFVLYPCALVCNIELQISTLN